MLYAIAMGQLNRPTTADDKNEYL